MLTEDMIKEMYKLLDDWVTFRKTLDSSESFMFFNNVKIYTNYCDYHSLKISCANNEHQELLDISTLDIELNRKLALNQIPELLKMARKELEDAKNQQKYINDEERKKARESEIKSLETKLAYLKGESYE